MAVELRQMEGKRRDYLTGNFEMAKLNVDVAILKEGGREIEFAFIERNETATICYTAPVSESIQTETAKLVEQRNARFKAEREKEARETRNAS